jgi:hypothetical protein
MEMQYGTYRYATPVSPFLDVPPAVLPSALTFEYTLTFGMCFWWVDLLMCPPTLQSARQKPDMVRRRVVDCETPRPCGLETQYELPTILHR